MNSHISDKTYIKQIVGRLSQGPASLRDLQREIRVNYDDLISYMAHLVAVDGVEVLASETSSLRNPTPEGRKDFELFALELGRTRATHMELSGDEYDLRQQDNRTNLWYAFFRKFSGEDLGFKYSFQIGQNGTRRLEALTT